MQFAERFSEIDEDQRQCEVQYVPLRPPAWVMQMPEGLRRALRLICSYITGGWTAVGLTGSVETLAKGICPSQTQPPRTQP